ncbi:dnaJ homolog subfamily C member 16-like [Mytilus galloprovincialis]|uniref:dnaJ homolog subfamily C member 16-like n=1 Tax=Mytilus galloprovincialis TaxID=29158 RepID=UPI003F7C8EBC
MKIAYLFLIACLCAGSASTENLYKVLGVSKTATQKEIKKAYKEMAREWHPDKNSDENAADRFTKINEAYETLGDSNKRDQYDRFGYTAAREQKPSHEYHNPFGNDFFRGFNFNFNGNQQGESVIEKFNINLRAYETKILPESDRKPCFLYTYTDFCFDCARIEHLVEKLIRDLEDVGICVGTFHAGRARSLTGALRIERVPTLIMLINGQLTTFRGSVNTAGLNNFARGVFPKNLFTKINDGNFQDFLDGWNDNHVRALLFIRREEISMRFLAPAFYHKEFIKFGYVNLWTNENSNLTKKYNVNRYRETLLMFNEDTQTPVATLVMPQLSRSTMEEVLIANRFITLPRLSSQRRFEEICPEEMKAKRRRLCVVLVTKKSETGNEKFLNSFRKYVQSSSLTRNERVKFAYIYEDTQKNVIQSFSKGDTSRTDDTQSKVIILWRMEKNHLSYNWLSKGWDIDNIQDSRNHLEDQVKHLLNSDQSLAYRVILPEFNNEHALHLIIRIFYKLWSWGEKVYHYLATYDAITYITVIMSLFLMFGMGFFLQKMASIEEEQIRETIPKRCKPRPPSVNTTTKCINLYELRPETYEELVTNSETGLTVIALVDEDTKKFLLEEFGKLVYPLTRYSGLTFGFVNLDLYMGWYRHLLEESVDKKIDLTNMKVKNCIGTVLAINGHRNYYYIYHPRPARKWIRNTDKVSRAVGFVDTDDSDSDGNKETPVAIEKLLKGLTDWTDRVFDGSIPKVRIPCWPELAIK